MLSITPYLYGLLAHLYRSTESYCCHFGIGVGVGLGITLKSFTSKFILYDGLSTVKQTILYTVRSCFKIFGYFFMRRRQLAQAVILTTCNMESFCCIGTTL